MNIPARPVFLVRSRVFSGQFEKCQNRCETLECLKHSETDTRCADLGGSFKNVQVWALHTDVKKGFT